MLKTLHLFNYIWKTFLNSILKDLLLITPPFTQLNTPYPATVYLKGFLNTKNISSFQMDLGIEVILELFSKKMLQSIFELASKKQSNKIWKYSKNLLIKRCLFATFRWCYFLFTRKKTNFCKTDLTILNCFGFQNQ